MNFKHLTYFNIQIKASVFLLFFLFCFKMLHSQDNSSESRFVTWTPPEVQNMQNLVDSTWAMKGDYQFLYKHNHRKAIEFFDFALEEDSNDGYRYFLRGLCKSEIRDFLGAIPDFTKAIELSPLDKNQLWVFKHDQVKSLSKRYYYIDAYWNRGYSKMQLKDYRGGIADFSKYLSVKKNVPEILANRGLCRYEIKDYLGAKNDFSGAIQLNSKIGDFYYYRGLCLIQLKEKNVGCLDLSKAGELGYNDAYSAIEKYCNE